MNPIDLVTDWNTISAVTAAWVLTYTLHSTLLLGGLWAAVRSGWVESPLVEDTLWKGMFVAGLLTATLQVGGGWGPEIYRLSEPVEAPDEPRISRFAAVHVEQYRAVRVPGRRAGVETAAGTVYRTTGQKAEKATWWSLIWADGPGGLVLLWLMGALAWGGWWAARHAAFRHRVRERERIEDDPAVDLLDRVCREAGLDRSVRLSRSEAVEAPVLLDHREICVPGRFFEELSLPQQRVVLAHEVGHLRHRDRSWTGFALALESLFFFQPLHRIGRRRLQACSEDRADRWAARTGTERCDLAEVLLTVARWVRGGASSDLAPTVYRDGSGLERRIRRLVEEETGESPSRSRLLAGLAVTSMALLVACAGPRVTNEVSDASPEPPETVAVELADAAPRSIDTRPPVPFDTTDCPCSPEVRAAFERARAAMEEARARVQSLPIDSIVEAAMREAEIEMRKFRREFDPPPPPEAAPVPESFFDMHRQRLEEARKQLREELERLERLERDFEERDR